MQKQIEHKFGDNQVIGFWDKYALVYSNAEEELCYFECPNINGIIGTCVEVELLSPIVDIWSPELENFLQDCLEN